MNIASPRLGSPWAIAAACSRSLARCWIYSRAMAISATRKINPARIAKTSLVESDRSTGASLRSLEPFVGERERGGAMDEAARNPHDQAGKPLVVDRIQADAGHPHRRILGVPRRGGEAHQCAECAAD